MQALFYDSWNEYSAKRFIALKSARMLQTEVGLDPKGSTPYRQLPRYPVRLPGADLAGR